MTARGKILVSILPTLEPVSEEGFDCGSEESRVTPRVLIVDATVEALEGRKIAIVDLRLVLPSQSADLMLRGMIEGETEIAITGMSPIAGTQNS